MKKIKNKIAQIKENDFFKSIMSYSLIFAILMFVMICIFAYYKKWFVRDGDGFRAHIVNLTYLRELLINFIRTGKLSTFIWYTGNGFDIFSNFAYFITGDFFSYLSIIVRTKDVGILYNILVVLRMYFVGIAFLCYTKYRKMDNTSSLIGTLMYTFSSYMLYAAIRHPYFIDAVILLPLLMIGIEKIIKENKFIYYTIIIAITFIVSFYFAYMLSLIIGIYGIILAIYTYKKDGIKKIINVLLKTILYSLIGIMISAVILLPTGVSYITSQRTGGNIVSNYPLSYYKNLVNCLLNLKNTGFWFVIGTQSLIYVTLSVFVFRKRKDNYPLFLLLMVLILPILFAKISSIFVGFNFQNNRWSFVYAFIFAFVTTMFFNDKYRLDKKDYLIIIASVIAFLILNAIFSNKLNAYFQIQMAMLLIWVLVLRYRDNIKNISKKFNLYNIVLILLFCIGIATSIKYIYGIKGHSYVKESTDAFSLSELTETANSSLPDFGTALNYIKKEDSSFYKVSRYPYDFMNISILDHFQSIGYYYSIIPNNYSELNSELRNSQYHLVRGSGEYDYRTRITTFLGVKYLINYDNGIVPYGYTMENEYKGKSKIYINNYYLPFGILYNNYITEEEYNNLSPLEKESSLLKTTVLGNDTNTKNLMHSNYDYSNNIKEIDYKIIDDNNIIKDSNNIVVKSTKKNNFEIEIDNLKNSELYVSIENLNYYPFSKKEMIDLEINKNSTPLEIANVKEKYKYYELNTAYTIKVDFNKILKSYSMYDLYTDAYYVNNTNFMFNLGYYDKTSGKIKITLSKQGNYTLDDIKVYAVSMDNYKEDIENLRRSNFEATEWDNGYLKGRVNAEIDGILQFQTMYSDGWKVYVDGEEVDTFTSNKYFLGIEIDAGEHEIYMKYSTPYLKKGLIVSIIAIAIFTGLCIYNKKREKIRKQ